MGLHRSSKWFKSQGKGWGDGLDGLTLHEDLSSSPQHPHTTVSYGDKAVLDLRTRDRGGKIPEVHGPASLIEGVKSRLDERPCLKVKEDS